MADRSLSNDCRFVLADVIPPHTLGRVLDDNGGEYEFQGPCTSTPSFNNTNGDSLREATHFYVTQRLRNIIGPKVWDAVSPQRSSDVQIIFDAGPILGVWSVFQPNHHRHHIETDQRKWISSMAHHAS